MDPLQGNEAIQQFIQLLEENNRKGQASGLSQLIQYMDGMVRQFDAVVQELQEVKEQLALTQMSPQKKALGRMVDTLEGKVRQARSMLDSLREKVSRCAARAVREFKETGVSALDRAVTALRVKRALEGLQKSLGGAVSGAKKSIETVERMGCELRSAGGHLKNAGRAMTGKEMLTVDGGREGRIQAVLLVPLRTTRNLLSKMSNATLAAIGSVEHLEQTAEAAREARAERKAEKKPSVRQDLEEKKAAIAARAASLPEKEHSPQEAAL